MAGGAPSAPPPNGVRRVVVVVLIAVTLAALLIALAVTLRSAGTLQHEDYVLLAAIAALLVYGLRVLFGDSPVRDAADVLDLLARVIGRRRGRNGDGGGGEP